MNNYLFFFAALSLTTPLVFVYRFHSSYIFSQLLFFQSVVFIMLPFSAGGILLLRRSSGRLLVMASLALFILSLVVSAAMGINLRDSFAGDWVRFGSITHWCLILFYTLSLMQVFRARATMALFSRYATIVATGAALFAVLQYSRATPLFFEGQRAFGSLGNPAFLASYLLLSVGIALYAMQSERRSLRWFYAVAIGLMISTVFTTGVRGAFVGLVAAAITYFFLQNRRMRVALRSPFFYTLLLIVFVGACVFFVSGRVREAGISELLRRFVGNEETIRARSLNLGIAARGIIERPIFGWGALTYPIVFQRHFDPRLYVGADASRWFDRSHNEFVDRIVEGGLLGICAYLILLGTPLVLACRGRLILGEARKMRSLAAFLVGYYVYLLFFFHSVADTMLFGVYLSLVASSEDEKKDAGTLPRAVSRMGWWFFVCGIAAAFIAALRPAAANLLIRSAELSASPLYAVASLDRARGISQVGDRVILSDLAKLITRGDEPAAAVRAAALFHDGVRATARAQRFDARFWLLTAATYRTLSSVYPDALQTSLQASTAAIALAPNHPLPYQYRSLVYLDLAYDETDEPRRRFFAEAALIDVRRAFMLAPEVHENSIIQIAIRGLGSDVSEELRNYLRDNHRSFSRREWMLVIDSMAESGDARGLTEAMDLLNDLNSNDPGIVEVRRRLMTYLLMVVGQQ